MMQLAEE